MLRRILLSMMGLSISINCYASNTRPHKYLFKHVTVSAGNWYDYVGDVQVNDDGDARSLTDLELTPFFSIAADYYFAPKWTVNPEIGYVVRRPAGDDQISKDLFFFRGDFAYRLTPQFNLRVGSSFMIMTMSSTGGEVTVENGESTQTYYRPSKRSTALNQTLDLGVEYFFDRMSARFQTYIYDFTDDIERKFTYSISLNYLIPLEELL